MNGILGFADLLKEPGLTGDEQLQYVGIIEKSGERMLNIINDLIDISKIESGLMELRNTITNVNDQLAACYAFFKPEALQSGFNFDSIPDTSLVEINIVTDREKLYAVLINLIKNALKYTHKGSIEFGYHYMPADGQKSGDNNSNKPYLQFYVKDTGIGIALEKQKAIFERFIQADTTIAKPYEGAGLGLAISKAYVEMLGGEIWVDSQPDIGSVFYFTLPVVYETDMDKPEDNLAVNSVTFLTQKKLTILIVEDIDVSDMYLTKVLQTFSKEIFHATNGKDAVEICHQNPHIDLILMDIKMPFIDGYEATRMIREFNKEVVIIAQTAFSLVGDYEKSIEAGCNGYLAKPLNKKNLLVEIKKYFEA